MLELPTVDLVAMDGVDGTRLVLPLGRTLRGIQFRRVLVFCPGGRVEFNPGQNQAIEFNHFQSDYEGWNRFMVKELWKWIPTGHCLFIHHDGYVLNPDGWTNEFLEWDYIGAPWWFVSEPDGPNGETKPSRYNVGNGGFSLRSKAFLDASSTLELPQYAPEDVRLCQENADHLRVKFGIRYAPESLAARFSHEPNLRFPGGWDGQFGFHNSNISKFKDL